MSELDENLPNHDDDQSQSKGEFLDAIRRHICQILGFDFGFIDVSAGREIKNVASFCFDDEADVAGEFVEALLDENKQPITTANTLVAQRVKESRRSWVGKAYSVEDVEQGLDDETEGFPYMIVPVLSNPGAGEGEVTGLIRVISFDASRDITSQDMMTLKLMGEHLASRTGLFGEFTASEKSLKSSDNKGDADNVLIVHSNRLVRRRFNRILGSSYHVLEAETAEKAFEILEDTRVDVLLADSDLQGATGFGFCKTLKESTKWKHVPVILVVTENSTTARVEGLNVGADDCIPDSCFDAELLARVSSSLRHRKSERELAVQLQLLEDYAQRLEKAHEQLSSDRQVTIQRNSQLEQLRRESEVQRHQDNLLHRISNIIRKSFTIRENLEEMLEALSGWFSLDCTFIVMPNDAEPEDTVRVECVSDKAYKVVAYDRDLDIYEIFKKNFQADQAIISNDAASDRRLDPFHKILKSGFAIQSLFFIPITYEQKLQGLLVGYKCEAKANWSRINETFMKSVVDQVAVGVVNARLYATVQRQATTDGLTGLFNHRTGQEKLADQMKQAERYQRRISVIMLDVDHFKSINDTHGHPAGDTVLKNVAKLIRNSCRDVDIPVRYGGEEFLLVLPEVTQDGATVVAERIRVALKSEPIKHEDVEINITGSFGVASFPDDADSQQAMLDLADKAMYLSKRLGRDQVHAAADLLFEPAVEEEKKTEDVAKDMRDGPFTPPVISEEARQHEELVPEVVDMVKSLAASLYAKSDYNKQHHLEVARMSELLAKVMGLSAQQVEQIRVAGLLHDVGVLQLPQELLQKEGRLSKEERDQVNQHATLGAQMLRPVRALKDICEILENHHERWDGTGYPKGLKGENIPLPARIVAIVDSYHAMISERPYRPAMTHEEALRVLKDGAGKQWDPFLIEIFSAVMKSMRETTQEVQAKVALAATLAKAGADPSGTPQLRSAANMSPGEIGHEQHSHEHAPGHDHSPKPSGETVGVPSAQPGQSPTPSAPTAVPNQAPQQPAVQAVSQPAQTAPEQAVAPLQAGMTQAQQVGVPQTQQGGVPQPQQAPSPQVAAQTPADASPSPAKTEAGDGGVEFEQRTEPSKISSVIGPVIKPVSPSTPAAPQATPPSGYDGERTGTQSLLKFVEEATEATTRSDEHTVSQENAPVSIAGPTRVPLPTPEEPSSPPTPHRGVQPGTASQPTAGLAGAGQPMSPQPAPGQPTSGQSAPLPTVPAQSATAADDSKSNEYIPGLPEKRGFGIPGPGAPAGAPQPSDQQASPAPHGQLAGLVRPTSQNLAIPQNAQPPSHGQPYQMHVPGQTATGQQPSGVAQQAVPGQLAQPNPNSGQPTAQQHAGQPQAAQSQTSPPHVGQQQVQGQAPNAGTLSQPGMHTPTGMQPLPSLNQPLGMPSQLPPGIQQQPTGTASGSSYNALPPQAVPQGTPPQQVPPQGTTSGTSYNATPGSPQPPGMLQQRPGMPTGTSSGTSYGAVPGAPSGYPSAPTGIQNPTNSSQNLPAGQVATGPLPPQSGQVMPGMSGAPNAQQAAPQPAPGAPGAMTTQDATGYPRPYAAGQPVPVPYQQPQQTSPQTVPQQAPFAVPNQVQPQQQIQQQPMQAPPSPVPTPPSIGTGGVGAMAPSVPPAPQQLQQQRPPQGATTTGKQPDTWDPYSDYDDEDEIEGGL